MTVNGWTPVVRQVIDERPWALVGLVAFVIVAVIICESFVSRLLYFILNFSLGLYNIQYSIF